jgi:carboxyl-terminal processing protease
VISDWPLELLVSSSVKATVVLGVGALAALCLRRGSAASRHLAWFLAAAGSMALPALTLLLPRLQVSLGVPPQVSHAAQALAPAGPKGGSVAVPRPREADVSVLAQAPIGRRDLSQQPVYLDPASVLRPETVARLETPPSTDRSLGVERDLSWVLLAWAAGLAVSAIPLALGALSLRRLARASRPVNDETTRRLLDRLADRVGVKRPVRLVRSPLRVIPMTWGVVRHTILLPEDSAHWSEQRLTVALLHELAHIRRCDCVTQLVAQTACLVYWFNPLSWLALGRVRGEQEQACDELALGCGLDQVAYADHLLAILAQRRPDGRRSAVAPAMAACSRLERRLQGILDNGRSRRAPGRPAVVIASVIVLAVLSPLAALSPRASARPFLLPKPDAGTMDREADEQKAEEDAVAVEVLAKVREAAVKTPDESALRRGAIKGILDALNDPYSAYYDAQKLADLDRSMQNRLTGIGVQLKQKGGEVLVITPLPDSPALKAGIRPQDVVQEVDGKPTLGRKLDEVVGQILGPEGQAVRLKIRHTDGRTDFLSVTRGGVTVPSVVGFRIDGDGRWNFLLDPDHAIGYVQVRQFTANTPGELKTAIGLPKDRPLKGLILDLRGCPGGLMSAAVEASQLFLSRGTIVTVLGRFGEAKSYRVDGPAPMADVPLVVLVDATTSSAAEIVVGALKDHDRAVVVGTRTLGKGSIQSLLKLKGGLGAIRLTSAYYELPGGANIDKREGKPKWGVDPSDGYYVPVDSRTLRTLIQKRLERARVGVTEPAAERITPDWLENNQADPQLAAALKTLIARTTRGAFEKVGLPLSELEARIKRIEDGRKRRQSLLDDLKKLEEELEELNREAVWNDGPETKGRGAV